MKHRDGKPTKTELGEAVLGLYVQESRARIASLEGDVRALAAVLRRAEDFLAWRAASVDPEEALRHAIVTARLRPGVQ